MSFWKVMPLALSYMFLPYGQKLLDRKFSKLEHFANSLSWTLKVAQNLKQSTLAQPMTFYDVNIYVLLS
jgi:hypothetical protein